MDGWIDTYRRRKGGSDTPYRIDNMIVMKRRKGRRRERWWPPALPYNYIHTSSWGLRCWNISWTCFCLNNTSVLLPP